MLEHIDNLPIEEFTRDKITQLAKQYGVKLNNVQLNKLQREATSLQNEFDRFYAKNVKKEKMMQRVKYIEEDKDNIILHMSAPEKTNKKLPKNRVMESEDKVVYSDHREFQLIRSNKSGQLKNSTMHEVVYAPSLVKSAGKK